mgnify:CR=1 FL=1
MKYFDLLCDVVYAAHVDIVHVCAYIQNPVADCVDNNTCEAEAEADAEVEVVDGNADAEVEVVDGNAEIETDNAEEVEVEVEVEIEVEGDLEDIRNYVDFLILSHYQHVEFFLNISKCSLTTFESLKGRVYSIFVHPNV